MRLSKVGNVEVFDKTGKLIRKDSLPDEFSSYEDITKNFFSNPILANQFDEAVLKDPSVLKSMPGKPCYGTCPYCYRSVEDKNLDKCPMFVGKVKGKAYSFFYCPDCQKYFKVV
jgi:hypothetical protein